MPATSTSVLVVDDDEATAGALARVLQKEQFQTTVAYRGEDALNAARGTAFHAAVVDIHLPDMNGLVLAQKLREQLGPQIPVIILSGDTSMATLKTLPHVGATYFFSKPVNANQFLAKLRESISQTQSL